MEINENPRLKLPPNTNLSAGVRPYPSHLETIRTMWANTGLEYVETWQSRDIHLQHTLHLRPAGPPAHFVFMFAAWVTGISFRPARSPCAQFGLAGVPLLVIKSNLN